MGKSIARPKILFPRITRNDADKNISHLVKYLFNFAFFKFGVEVTLMMLAIVISTRKDIISVIYAVWLCVLFGTSRASKQRIWPIFQSFIVILIVVQYIIAVNLPPFLCFGKHFSHSSLPLFLLWKLISIQSFRLSMENHYTETTARIDLAARPNAP